jgi:transcriptional regulator with XRE-family HTH domain
MLNIGYTLIVLRVRNRMTRLNVALKMNVDTSLVEKWEKNLIYPSYDALLRLAKIYQVHVDEITSGDISKQYAIDLRMYNALDNRHCYDA